MLSRQAVISNPRYVKYVAFVNDLRVVYGTSWATALASLPTSVNVTLNDATLVSAGVTWAQGTYVTNSAVSHIIKGTLSLPPGIGNPQTKQGDVTVWMLPEGHNVLVSSGLTGVFYDFIQLYTTADGPLVNGEVGLEDLGGGNLDAVIVSTPDRGYVQNVNNVGPYSYALYATALRCLSAGSPLNHILSANSHTMIFGFLSTDGIPTGSSNYFGNFTTGPNMGANFYNSAGRGTYDYADGVNRCVWQSTATMFVNLNSGYHVVSVMCDWVANTVVVRLDGVAVTGTIVIGSIAAINPALFNCTQNFYIGNTNVNGAVGTNHAEIVAVERFALYANMSTAQRNLVETYFAAANSYPFGSFYWDVKWGDSQSEGAAERARIIAQGLYLVNIPRVIIYFKTDRTSADNGTWQGFFASTNNELLGTGTVISDDVSLGTLVRDHLLQNVMMVKASEGGTQLGDDWLPVLGTHWIIATQYYYDVSKTKLTTAYPGKRLKPYININLGTNDQSVPAYVTAWAANVQSFITALRAYNTEFADCPLFWTQMTLTQSATETSMNAQLKTVIESNNNCYYVSAVPADEFSNVVIAKRKIDLTTGEKLGVSPTTPGGDDGHRSYLGMNAEGETKFDALKTIGFLPP